MTANSSENTETSKTSQTSIDVERQENETKSLPSKQNVAAETNNNFLGEKVKERALPGINGSLVLLYGVFLCIFTIGWVNLNRCPLNRLIPVYLIVAGFLGALAKYLSKYENKYCFWSTTLLIVLDVFCQAVGSYVVYKEYQPNYQQKNGVYCNRTTYLVAFWTLTIEYTLIVLFILLSCFYMIMRKDFRTESGTK